MTLTAQVRIDIGGKDGLPHTFLVLTDAHGVQREYGLVPVEHGSAVGPGKIDETGGTNPHEYQIVGQTEQITQAQYDGLMARIMRDKANPPEYFVIGDWAVGDLPTGVQNCTAWVVDVWNDAGLPADFGITDKASWNPYSQAAVAAIKDAIASTFAQAKNWLQHRGTSMIGPDGNGLETKGMSTESQVETNAGWPA